MAVEWPGIDQQAYRNGRGQHGRGGDAGRLRITVHECVSDRREAVRCDVRGGRRRGGRVQQGRADRCADLLRGAGHCRCNAGVPLVPKRAGGTRTVPACPVCHEMKDRIPWRFWDTGAHSIAFDELFGRRMHDLRRIPREQISARTIYELVFEPFYLEMEAEWDRLSPLARLMYAKWRCGYEDGKYLTELEAEVGQPGDAD